MLEKPTEGLLGLRDHWVPVTAAHSLPHSKMTGFRPKLTRPQPTALLPGARPGCLRNPSHTLLHERTWGTEPGGQLKHKEGAEREGPGEPCPGSRVQDRFPHSATYLEQLRGREGANLLPVENTELLKTL